MKRIVNKILFNICHTRDERGFIVARPHTEVFYELACYLYKKGW